MNDWDRDNFNFIMNCSHKTFMEWLDQASDEDLVYFDELIKVGKKELAEEISRLKVLEMESSEALETEMTEANKYLSKFRLKKGE